MSKLDDDKLTPEERLQKAVDNSGHNLNLKVVRMLEKAGWHVDLSPYYCDDTTGKPREIDTVASKIFSVKDSLNRELANFACWLHIECKRFNQEVAFRMMPREPVNTKAAIKFNGFGSLNIVSQLNEHHHYYQFPQVGKLSNMYHRKDEAHDPLFEAITQPVKSLIFFRDSAGGNCLLYPVSVYEGIDGIYQLENDSRILDPSIRKTHSVFEILYSYRDLRTHKVMPPQTFFIDFVHRDEFANYLEKIEKEVEPLKWMLRSEADERTFKPLV